MYVESISFSKEYFENNKWKIDNFDFSKINLIAGKNASGKTRILNSISILIDFLRDGKIENDSSIYNWNIKLLESETEYIYDLKIDNSIVLFEELKIDGTLYFSRNKSGKGQIKYDSQDSKLDFEIENNKILLATKRDKIQHKLLEPIFNWISSFYLFKFGDSLGQALGYDIKNKIFTYDDKQVVYKFREGLKEFKEPFKNKIIETFNSIGYDIEDIYTADIAYQVYALYIKENGKEIYQREISQGMFRALSLIIQITYLDFTVEDNITILIDDIGEGLDFERADSLIRYLIKNAEKQKDKMQLIMTTNDRLVMNNVPLDYWIIVDKDDNGKINFYSEKSHRKNFENFEDIGLNNFDFFSGEYYKNCVWGD